LCRHKDKCRADITEEEDAEEVEVINIIKKEGKAVTHLVQALVLHKNQEISRKAKNVVGRRNKSTLPIDLKRLKNMKDRFTSITQKK
jgi:hypothetical protein